MSNNYDLIAKAIKEKLQVTAYYQGFYREMCPHALGSKKDENRLFSISLAVKAVKVL